MIGQRVIEGLKWTAAVKLAGQVTSWASTLLVIRLLAPSDYGLLAYATIFVGFAAMFSEVGLSDALVQATNLTDERLRSAFGAVILVNVTVAFVLAILVAPLAATFFNQPRIADILRVLCLSFPIEAFGVLSGAQLARALAFKRQSLVALSGTLATSGVTLTLAYLGAGVWALVAGSLLGSATRVIGMNLAAPVHVWPRLSLRRIRDLLGVGGNITAARGLWYFYSQADVLIVGKLLGESLLGLYSVAMQLASMPAQRVGAIFGTVAYPAFARARMDGGEVAHYLLMAFRALSFLSFPVFFGMASIAPDLIRIVLGEKWLGAVVPFALLCIVMPLRVAAPINYAALQAIGHPRVNLRNIFISSIAMPLAFALGCRYGLLGVSMAWLLVYPLMVLQGFHAASRHLGVSVRQMFLPMGRPFIAAASMGGGVLLLRSFLPIPELPKLAILIVFGALVYGAVTYAINRAGLREFLAIIRK